MGPLQLLAHPGQWEVELERGLGEGGEEGGGVVGAEEAGGVPVVAVRVESG